MYETVTTVLNTAVYLKLNYFYIDRLFIYIDRWMPRLAPCVNFCTVSAFVLLTALSGPVYLAIRDYPDIIIK